MNKARLLTYPEMDTLLSKFNLSLPLSRFVTERKYVLSAAAEIGYPLVLKLVSPEMSHKSDAGLIKLNLQNEKALSEALDTVCLAAEGFMIEGFLLQRLVPKGIEVILGVTRDEQFGPVLVFGAGGVLVEFLKDTSLRLPPITTWEAEQMVLETKISQLLDGYRDLPAVNRPALYQAIKNLSDLVEFMGERLVSLDINPMILSPDGELVVDARVYVSEVHDEK